MSKLADQAIREDLILWAIQRGRHKNDLFYTHVKDGPTQARERGELRVLDAVAFRRSWTNPLVTGYEIKCTRSDWVRDNKWHEYRCFCHAFYLVAPKDVILLREVPEGVGLIHFIPERQSIRMVLKARRVQVAMNPKLLFYVLLTRTEPDRHPMFSDTRIFLESWVADRSERQALGRLVANRLGARLHALQDRIRKLEDEAYYQQQYRERYEHLARQILAQTGVDVQRQYDWEQRLASCLGAGLPAHFPELVRQAASLAADLQRLVGQPGIETEKEED